MNLTRLMPFGANTLAQEGVRFALWAPDADRVTLELGLGDTATEHSMARDSEGWHRCTASQAGPGDRYRFRLPDGVRVPDPASRFNPDGVHAASEVVDPARYTWRDDSWRGRPWSQAVVCELHLGTFTVEGTYAAAATRLEHLAELGFTAIELMPLADFAGRRNWGYDGVLLFAPDPSYGKPDELKAFVDAAHGLGLMVLVDVVYNHFGPDGNYLHAYCPQFFNPARATPWGAAIHYDGSASRVVRDFFVCNALYRVEEYHVDGLRIDAIQTIRDESPLHVVREICAALRDGPGRERHVHVVLENEMNGASFLGRDAAGTPLAGTAQWNDDFHHAMHVVLTGEIGGYYADYATAPLECLGRALAEGFVYQGEPSAYRDGAPRGEPSAALPPAAFVAALQTHDQIGNRALGERIAMLADRSLLDAAYACLLLAPHVPMLFMGEEFEASSPFFYFCDFDASRAAAVTRGRRAAFGRFPAFADASVRQRVPDPNDAATFETSRLIWREREISPHAERMDAIRQLLALRCTHLVPRLVGPMHGGTYRVEGSLLRVTWTLGDRARWHLLANFGSDTTAVDALPAGEIVHARGFGSATAAAHRVARGAVRVTLERTHLD